MRGHRPHVHNDAALTRPQHTPHGLTRHKKAAGGCDGENPLPARVSDFGQRSCRIKEARSVDRSANGSKSRSRSI